MMKCRINNDRPMGTPECGNDATHVAVRCGSGTIGVPADEREMSPGGYTKPAGEGYVRAFPICTEHMARAGKQGDQVFPLPIDFSDAAGEFPDIVTVRLLNATDDSTFSEFKLTRDEYNEIAIEAAVRALTVDAWVKTKILLACDRDIPPTTSAQG